MSAGVVIKKNWTPQEYLAWERAAEQKHEYFQGEIFAMAGGSREHNLIVANIAGELRNILRQRRSEVYPSDLRVKVSATGLYTYPDISVVCIAPQFEDEEADTLLNPGVIFEVLSDSTESYDRGKKFEQYRSILSLQDYVLVSQDRVLVEHYARRENGPWLLREHRADDTIAFESIQCELIVDEIYLKVFPKDQPA